MRITELKEEAWRDKLNLYSTDYGRVRGPSANVKLYGVWDKMRKLEAELDIEIPDDIDPEGWTQYDIVEQEMGWFRGWIGDPGYVEEGSLLDFVGPLDSERFELAGRSGGQLVYNLHERYGDRELTPDEAEALAKLWEMMPSIIDGIEWQLATEYARQTVRQSIEDKAERKIDKHERKIRVAAAKGRMDKVGHHFERMVRWQQVASDSWETADERVEMAAIKLQERLGWSA